jgi:membrane associated rhomboid family serine protease
MRYYSRYEVTRNILGGDYPMVKLLLIANFSVFIVQWIAANTFGGSMITDHLALSSRIWRGEVWQLVTYMFLHADIWHVLFNMFALWMFGKELEMTWGSGAFLKYYFICGIGAGLTFLLFSKGVVIGASGAVFGILLAFGMTFPNQIILMSLLFPIKAKYMVIIFGVITFMNIAKTTPDGIAHFAHLGGMVFGLLYLKRDWFMDKMHTVLSERPEKQKEKIITRSSPDGERHELLRDSVDAILDKINEVGYDHLTEEEKSILLEASHHLTEKDKPGFKH